MANVITLPGQPAPRQITVRYVVKALGEHYQAFLNTNNLNGFQDDPDRILTMDKIHDILLMAAASKYVSRDEFRLYISRICELSGGLLSRDRVRRSLYTSMGYAKGRVINYNDEGMIVNVLPIAQKIEGVLSDMITELGSEVAIDAYIEAQPSDHPLKQTRAVIRSLTHISRNQAADLAMSIRDHSFKRIKLGRAYEYLARTLGFKTWRALLALMKDKPTSESVIIRRSTK